MARVENPIGVLQRCTGYRKSDKFVVPEKFPNKPKGAEGMEERDLPKENERSKTRSGLSAGS